MAGRRRAVVSGPLAEFVEGFLVELVEGGYSPRSFEAQLRLLRYLSVWLAVNGLTAGDLRGDVLVRFIADRRETRSKMRSERALGPLLGYLHRLGVAPEPGAKVPVTPAEVVLERFGRYLTVERGLGATTVAGYLCQAKPFLAAYPDADAWRSLTARQVGRFVTGRATRRSARSAQAEAKALRALLRWMWVEGIVSAPLAEAVGPFAAAKGTRPPKALTAKEVTNLRRAVSEPVDKAFMLPALMGRCVAGPIGMGVVPRPAAG